MCWRFRNKNFNEKRIVLLKKNPFPCSVLLILFDDINQVRPSDESAKQLFLNYVLKIDLENTIYIHIYIIYIISKPCSDT